MGRKSVAKQRNQNPKRRKKYLMRLMPIFYEYGLQELSMDDISQKLDISKATLYNYFATKEEMVAGILDHVLGEIGYFETIMADKERSFMDRYFSSVLLLTKSVSGISNRFLMDVQSMYPVLWEIVREFRNYSANVLERFYEEGKQLGILSAFSTNILVLSDRLFFDALTEPQILDANNLTIQEAFSEYFKLKCFGMIKMDAPWEVKREALEMLKEIEI
jgi:AcrR family transcriptional regulator